LASRRASGEEKMRPWPLACAAGCRRGAAAAGGGLCGGRAQAPAARRGCSGAALQPASARARRAARGRLHVLAVAGQHRDDVVDRNVGRALGHQDLRDRALVDRLDLHGRLVGLDLRDDVAGLDLVALLLEPLGKIALLHRGRQRRHQNVDWHRQ
jgi:hypothetical protein